MLFLDEPVSGLDPDSTTGMYSVIRELNLEGLTVVMISHDTESSLKYATRILELGKGKCVINA